jgi:hypothetical protein
MLAGPVLALYRLRGFFTARGLLRCRRSGLIRSRISEIASRIPRSSFSGGKSRLVTDLTANCTEGAHKGDSINVNIGLFCRFDHVKTHGIMS